MKRARPKQARGERPILFRLLAAAGSLGLFLLLAEAGLRLVWTPPSVRSDRAFEAHNHYGWAPIPGVHGIHATVEYEHSFSHSAQGLRGDRIFEPRREGERERRLLFLGDSFTYGLGVANDSTFVSRLAAAWPDVQVANAGCNGHGTREELAVFNELGAAFSPDVTVLVFFWNDLDDNLKRSVPGFELDGAGRLQRTDPVPSGFDPLELRATPGTSRESKWTAWHLHRMIKESLRSFRYRFLGRRPRFIQRQEQLDEAWEVTTDLLLLMKHRAEQIGTRLVVVSIPSQNRVDPSAKIKNIEPLHIEIEERLAEVCREIGLPYHDLLPELREIWNRDGVDLYYYADLHLNVAGNEVVAELLREILEPLLREPPDGRG